MVDLREMTVLVVDDMENMYNSIRSIMRVLKFGRRFYYAENAEEALKLLKDQDLPIDLLILDNNMPGMKGVELLQMIRDDTSLRELPVVMITADAQQEFVTMAAESEIDAYLLKPITVGLVNEKIPPVIERANDPPPMMLHLKQAYKYEEEGDLEKAVLEAQKALAENPDSSRPVRELGKLYMQAGDLPSAEKHLLKAAKMNHLDVIAFNHLGDLYLAQNDLDNALNYYSRAVEISPRNYERSLNLGKLMIQKHLTDKAVPVLNKVYELAGDQQQVKEEIIDLCLQEGETDYAEKLLKGLVSVSPGRGDLLHKLGRISLQNGNDTDALKYLSEAEQFDRNNTDIKLHMAQVYISQGMLLRAETPLKAVLEINPEHKEAREMLRQCV